MNPDALLWLTIGSALLTCFASIGARALREFSRHDLQELCQLHQNEDRFGDIIRNYDRVALGVEMVVVMAMSLTIVSGSLWAWHEFSLSFPAPGFALLVLALLLSLVVAITAVWIPWSVARLCAASFLYHTWNFWLILSRLITPLVWCARVLDMILHRASGRSPTVQDEESFEEEIRTIVTEGHREGLLEEEAREMIEGIIELGDANVARIMTPRTEMHMLQVSLPWEDVLESIIAVGHTRIPVYEKNRDDIIGILYSKDLLPELANSSAESPRPIVEILRKPLFVPESKPVDDLLQLFQQSHTHIAVVLDEYGGVSGLVTIEDVLEEIVGEIVDEYDQEEEAEIRIIDEHVCEALGRAHVDEINEQMSFQLPENDDFDTIGGFVFAEFGRVPIVGEVLTWEETVRITVLEATRRRVNRVRLERVPTETREIA